MLHLARDRFGAQAIVAVIEHGEDEWDEVCTRAVDLDKGGAGEILVQSTTREGTLKGYDIDAIGMAAAATNCPVIASGGCADYGDMLQAFRHGASACAAGAMFAFTDATPRGAARYLGSRGMEVRL